MLLGDDEVEDNNYNPYAGVYKRAVELLENDEYQEGFIKMFSVVENDGKNYMANYYLGNCYFYGYGTEINYDKAFKNYFIAASNKIVSAIYMVGYCYEFGHGVEKAETQAISWYMEAAKQDNTSSQYRLGLFFKNGIGIEKNLNFAATWFLKAAQKGLVEAQKEAGICYERLNQPLASATMYLAAAEQNDSFSCAKIAKFYAEGYGCPKSEDLAIYFYTQAAKGKNVEAVLELSRRYRDGDGVTMSIRNAIQGWLSIAEDSTEAQICLAKCYIEGNGVKKDYPQALKWLYKAAETGSIEAMLDLAKYSMEPLPGYEKDEVSAKIWWSKAASLGSTVAMYALGKCYENATGVMASNYSEAYKWYRLASIAGNEEASEACKRFKKSFFGDIKLVKNKKIKKNKA